MPKVSRITPKNFIQKNIREVYYCVRNITKENSIGGFDLFIKTRNISNETHLIFDCLLKYNNKHFLLMFKENMGHEKIDLYLDNVKFEFNTDEEFHRLCDFYLEICDNINVTSNIINCNLLKIYAKIGCNNCEICYKNKSLVDEIFKKVKYEEIKQDNYFCNVIDDDLDDNDSDDDLDDNDVLPIHELQLPPISMNTVIVPPMGMISF